MLHVGDSAADAWSRIAPDLVTGRRPTVQDLQWIDQIWVSEDGDVLIRFQGEH